MASEGPNSPGSAQGEADWDTPTNILISNDSRAWNTQDTGFQHILRGYNFSFSIPIGATIDGIVVEVEGFGNENNINRRDISVSLGTSGYTPSSDWKDEFLPYTEGDEGYITLGGANDTWNFSGIDADDVNNTNFGVLIRDADVGYGDHYIDHARVTVYYTEAVTLKVCATIID